MASVSEVCLRLENRGFNCRVSCSCSMLPLRPRFRNSRRWILVIEANLEMKAEWIAGCLSMKVSCCACRPLPFRGERSQ